MLLITWYLQVRLLFVRTLKYSDVHCNVDEIIFLFFNFNRCDIFVIVVVISAVNHFKKIFFVLFFSKLIFFTKIFSYINFVTKIGKKKT